MFRPLEADERKQRLHRLAVDPEDPLVLDAEEDRGFCHGCRMPLTSGGLRLLRSAVGVPAGETLVLVCASCGAENVTASGRG